MTYWELVFVYEKLRQYGYAPPMLDVGGVPFTTIADAEGLSGYKGIVRLKQGSLWAGVDTNYNITHDVEASAENDERAGTYMTIVSTSTLEHVANPFIFMRSVKALLGSGGLAIIVTVFMWNQHGDYATDYWRFTGGGLEELARVAGLDCLEAGTHELNLGRKHSYIVCSNGPLGVREHNIVFPEVVQVKG